MADILAIPAEFDKISVWHIKRGVPQEYGEKCLLPRPPLGPFTHHAVRTFAKKCSEGQIGLTWREHLVCAQESWQGLTAEEHSNLGQAAEKDKQRYDEQVVEPTVAEAGAKKLLLQQLDEKQLQENGNAPSAFDLFKNSPESRPRVYDAVQGPIGDSPFFPNEFLWLWGRLNEEERSQWREDARRRLDITNDARRMKGDEELVLNPEPPALDESPPPGKRMRYVVGSKSGPPKEVAVSKDEQENEQDDEQRARRTEVDPMHTMQWKPTEDQNLTTAEKEILESIPPNLRRWDRPPREARNAYTLYYTERVTSEGSPHQEENPHSPTTRAKIHADWEAADDETRQHLEALAQTDEEQYNRQSKEYNEWQTAWRDKSHRFLLRKVISRWRPHASFDDGENRVSVAIHRQGPEPFGDYGLCSLYYPVIRTDYSNDAVYKHLRHVLLNSDFEGFDVGMDMTFYDGVNLPSVCASHVGDNGMPLFPSYAEEDRRASDREWCETYLGNKSLDDLKASFGELKFYRKEHIPIYSFGGRSYAIIVDSQSMKDGTIVFAALSSYDFVDTRPGDDPGPDGAWQQDRSKDWYLAPRVQAADVVIKLVNMNMENFGWAENLEHRIDHGLDLLSDHKAQQWRGWQCAFEYIFGEQALENVVGGVERIPSVAFLEEEEDE